MESHNEYRMDYKRRGLAVIINNFDFWIPGVRKRAGAEVDAQNMEEVLNNLGFEVKQYKNKTAREIRDILDRCKSDNTGQKWASLFASDAGRP